MLYLNRTEKGQKVGIAPISAVHYLGRLASTNNRRILDRKPWKVIEKILKRLATLFLYFMTGLAGNLIASWILQDVWLNLFKPMRLVGTMFGVGVAFLLIAWWESRTTQNVELAITGNVFNADEKPVETAFCFVSIRPNNTQSRWI